MVDSTGEYYGRILYLPNTNNECALFTLKNAKRPIWYARIKRFTPRGGYYRRSMQTFDLSHASQEAYLLYIKLRDAESKGITLHAKKNFSQLAEEWLDARLKSGYSPTSTRVIKYQYINHFIPFFGAYNVEEIHERTYIEYLNNYRLNPKKYLGMRKKPTIRTLDVEQQNLRSFLNWAFQRGHISKKIHMRKIIRYEFDMIWDRSTVNYGKAQRREMVSTEVYDTFRRFYITQSFIRGGCKVEATNMLMARRRMHFYLLSIYNFVCRPGVELLNLKFKDLTAVESEEVDGAFYVRMRTTHGKKVSGRRPNSPDELIYHSDYNYFGHLQKWIHFLKTGVDEYAPGHSAAELQSRIDYKNEITNEALLEDQAELNQLRERAGIYSGASIPGWESFPTDPDAYVFPVLKVDREKTVNYGSLYQRTVYKTVPMNAHATTRFLKTSKPKVKQWAQKAGRMNAKLDAEIDLFAPYSVRHIAIRNLIAESRQNFSIVAERANTSVSMIEDFYYKYGLKPEGRLVSKHPTPSPKNTKYYDDEAIDEVASVVKVEKSKKKK